MMNLNRYKHSISSVCVCVCFVFVFVFVFFLFCFFRVISLNPFWKFLRFGNSAWDDFWGLIFGPEIFLGFVESSRDFFGTPPGIRSKIQR